MFAAALSCQLAAETITSVPAPTPPPAVVQAYEAFGRCLENAVGQTPGSLTPEAGAAQVLAACAEQKRTMDAQFEAWIASESFPAADRDAARRQHRDQIGEMERQVADWIRFMRASPATVASPAD